ncbi:hypothetical protein ESA94_10175 [Lacibacter luteus]|uniref:Uncharacterized protein n=1 Tax=Lacibacter luteus TaxID=2508719 RepID=A0A4Q1CKB5_9BACT|nr:hypothetical protein [Lacibacter luteus]RXK60818.1 hypothetical protein ESA94_10175 [Lacibacter luteus]
MEENKPNPQNNEEQPSLPSLNEISIDESIAPAAETSEIIHPTSDIKDMEVHHHAHDPAAPHHKKNWKNYFWEFLMLFLAVFCGFLAEYQLEHKIERDRAKELAKSFYEELKNDSVNVQIKSRYRIRQEESLFYLERYFQDSSLTNLSKQFQLSFLIGIIFRSPSVFEPRTVVLEQLKNSGSLRYFKNDELQKLIGDLLVSIKNIYDRQQIEQEIRNKYLWDLMIRHYDYSFDDKIKRLNSDLLVAAETYEKSDQVIPFQFKSIEKFDKQGTINAIGLFGRNGLHSTRELHYKKYMQINAALLRLLRNEYHLK